MEHAHSSANMIFVSENADAAALDTLAALGYTVRTLAPFAKLAPPVASHADMLLYTDGDALLTYDEYFRTNENIFRGVAVHTTERIACAEYPRDIALNALLYRGSLYCAEKHTDENILASMSRRGVKVRNVAQGYARCSVCAFEGGCITADPSISRALIADGVPTLTISAGAISLDGYSYGFIGGACAVDGAHVMFFGDPLSHPDGEKIAEFIVGHGGEVISLCGGTLTDVGGAVVV